MKSSTRCRLAVLWLVAGVVFASDQAALSLPDLSGNPQTLEQYRGHVVVLNFWATWCVPCREEMPLLVDVQQRYASRGLVVVGASADAPGTQDQVKPFVSELDITFPIWTDATTAHMEQLGLGAALPATAIIDQRGQIAFRVIGVLEREELTERLDYLLSGRQGNSPEPVVDTLSDAAHGDHEGHQHGEEEEHAHGGVGVEGASMVPS